MRLSDARPNCQSTGSLSFFSLGLALFSGACAIFAQGPRSDATAALERLRSLNGKWEGTFQWSGVRSNTGKMNASYYSTGNGSTVIENLLTEDGTPAMTTAYHLDGTDLRMTHFCAAQNQPRLKARQIDLTEGIVEFTFVDITNLRSPQAPHVVGMKMHFIDSNHIAITFDFEGDNNLSTEVIDLRRVAGRPPDPKSDR